MASVSVSLYSYHCGSYELRDIDTKLQPEITEKVGKGRNTIIYLPVNLDVIPQMTCYLTDQNQKPLDMQGKNLTIQFHIRAC